MIKRLAIFALVAALLLPVGCISAQWVWFRFHHRYDSPMTGFYHGDVTVTFESFHEPFYSLTFNGETLPRWYWKQPTNFSYTTLEVVAWRFGGNEQRATVSLPAMTYHSGDASGEFTRDVLASWLFGPANRISNTQVVDAIFGYFEAAARGALPPSRHHPYFLEQPVQARVTHFRLGYGVGSTVYIGLAVWLLMVVMLGRKILRKSHEC